MRKIPTLFRRDPDDMRRVLPEVTPGCEWVTDGEGVATRKYDGTCVMFDGSRWWARREVKPGKKTPEGYDPISTDPNTGKTMGWEPIEQSGFAKTHSEALQQPWAEEIGTYELCGPKINRNPEAFECHRLLWHDIADPLDGPMSKRRTEAPRDFDGLREYLSGLDGEGIVWHHPDGRMAKLKKRDFPERTPR